MKTKTSKKMTVTVVCVLASLLAVVGTALAQTVVVDLESVPFDPADYGTTKPQPGTAIGGPADAHPNLQITSTNGPLLLKEGLFPATYRGEAQAGSILNACLGGTGFGDASINGVLNTGEFSDHSFYEFTFLNNVTVSSFAVNTVDYGDFFPLNTTTNMTHTAWLIAYDAGGTEIDRDTLTFTSVAGSGDPSVDRTLTVESRANPGTYYDLDASDAGDACLSLEQGDADIIVSSPGHHQFMVSAPGIAKVRLEFDGPESVDPGMALDNLVFYEEDGGGDMKHWCLDVVKVDKTADPADGADFSVWNCGDIGLEGLTIIGASAPADSIVCDGNPGPWTLGAGDTMACTTDVDTGILTFEFTSAE